MTLDRPDPSTATVELFVYITRAIRFQFWICSGGSPAQNSGRIARAFSPRLYRTNQSARKFANVNKSTLIFYGAGGHARVAIEAASAAGLKPALVIDDHPKTDNLAGLSVVAAHSMNWDKLGSFRFIVAIGDNTIRARVFNELRKLGGSPETIVHPFSWISPSAIIGPGTVVFGGVVVNANAQIGENCILNTGCSVDHDGNIGAHSHVCPGARLAGDVTIGERVLFGTGALCIPGIRIGSDVTVGAGSVIIRNLPDHWIAYGNPARPRLPRETN
jgi:sugar O-acyltransferase (sialic acid O-acetyltransferase NeuD family)